MKKIKLLAIINFTANFVFLQNEPSYDDNYLIARFDSSLTKNEIQVFLDDTNVSLDKLLLRKLNIWRLSVNLSRSTTETAKAEVGTLAVVTHVQHDHYVTQRTIPDDTYFTSQWGLHNTGQSGGTTDADIDAPEAWDYTTGGTNAFGDEIVVAVIDGGCKLNHTDLDDNIWTNVNEGTGDNNDDNCPGDCNVDDDGDGLIDEDSNSCGSNGYDINGNPCTYLNDMDADDDENGYIDDINGWNAYNSTGNIPNNNHGTHVSGIIGAEGNNNSMVAGVNWFSKIMVIAGSSGQTSTVLEAYGYVLDQRFAYNESNGVHGAFIVATNSSFGIDYADCGYYSLWNDIYNAMGEAGIISVAATANENWNIDAVGDVPTGCDSDYLITVTNTTRNDTKNTGAGYGATTIDLGAPGTNIISTWGNGGTVTRSGTSMAAPHVAGSIALIHAAASQEMTTIINLDYGQGALIIKNAIIENVDPIADLLGNTVSGGRLNVHNTIQYLDYSITLTNRHNGGPNSNLGGTLSLYNLNTPNMDYEDQLSDSNPVPVIIDDHYTVITNNYELQGEKHLNWNDETGNFRLAKNNFEMTFDNINDGLTAIFDFQNEVTITSANDVEIQFHDPWFLENPEADPNEWNQPDDFRPISEQGNGNGNLLVFLDQVPDDGPAYRIKAPKYYATTDAIYEFSHWSVLPENSATLNANNRNTSIIFHQANASVMAHYIDQVSNVPGMNIIIEEDDKLVVPENANIQFANTPYANDYILFYFYDYNEEYNLIHVRNGELILNENSRLSGNGDGYWGGIFIEENGKLNIKNATIENAVVGNGFITPSEEDISSIVNKTIFRNNLRDVWYIHWFHFICQDGFDGLHTVEYNNCDFIDSDFSILLSSDLSIDDCGWPTTDGYVDISINNSVFTNTECSLFELNADLSIYNWFYNTVFDAGYDGLDESNIQNGSDPLFIDHEAGNFHLSNGSPLIDAGDPDSPFDPDGTIADIGAFYYTINFSDFVLNISGEVGGHPIISWDPVYFGENNQDEALGYDIYSFNEFDNTPVYFTSTSANSVEDQRFIITLIEQEETGTRHKLKETTPTPDMTFSIKRYWNIKALDNDNHETTHSPSVFAWVDIGGPIWKLATPIIPKDYELNAAFPNPFNPTITIPFGLPFESDVTINIYNMVGQLVRSLQSDNIQAGFHSLQWKGTTNSGQKVPSGLYIVRMNAVSTDAKKSFQKSQKIVLLK